MVDPEAAVPRASRRATGGIPRSWALPAEAVTDDTAPTSSSTVVVGVLAAAAAIALVVAAGALGGLASTDTAPRPDVASPRTAPPTAATVATVATAPPITTTAPPAPVAPAATQATPEATPEPAPEPAPATEPTPPAPASTPGEATDEPTPAAVDEVTPTRLRARAIIGKARVAARDGNRDKALVLAEQAVALDAGCGGCWRTLALLRRQAGDKAGAARARARADAADDPLP